MVVVAQHVRGAPELVEVVVIGARKVPEAVVFKLRRIVSGIHNLFEVVVHFPDVFAVALFVLFAKGMPQRPSVLVALPVDCGSSTSGGSNAHLGWRSFGAFKERILFQ
ncbi:MAG: hypothetical protein IPO40_13610 [Fibrobacteres bacterium]|nr:hypothetical protein [Fibrobacterota bacterium]